MSRIANQNGNGHREPNGRWKKGITPEGANIFPPGVSGNPKGRPSAGATVREWWNQMQGWSLAKLTAVANDAEAPVAKVAAANQWIRGVMNGTELDRVLDRTDGKPAGSLHLTGPAVPSEVHERMARVLNDPEAVAAANLLARRIRGDATEPGTN